MTLPAGSHLKSHGSQPQRLRLIILSSSSSSSSSSTQQQPCDQGWESATCRLQPLCAVSDKPTLWHVCVIGLSVSSKLWLDCVIRRRPTDMEPARNDEQRKSAQVERKPASPALSLLTEDGRYGRLRFRWYNAHRWGCCSRLPGNVTTFRHRSITATRR